MLSPNLPLTIREENIEPYLDIHKDIKLKQNGLFTFVLRVNNGKIVDYSQLEYVDAKQKYLQLKQVTFTELTIFHHLDPGVEGAAIRPDDN